MKVAIDPRGPKSSTIPGVRLANKANKMTSNLPLSEAGQFLRALDLPGL